MRGHGSGPRAARPGGMAAIPAAVSARCAAATVTHHAASESGHRRRVLAKIRAQGTLLRSWTRQSVRCPDSYRSHPRSAESARVIRGAAQKFYTVGFASGVPVMTAFAALSALVESNHAALLDS